MDFKWMTIPARNCIAAPTLTVIASFHVLHCPLPAWIQFGPRLLASGSSLACSSLAHCQNKWPSISKCSPEWSTRKQTGEGFILCLFGIPINLQRCHAWCSSQTDETSKRVADLFVASNVAWDKTNILKFCYFQKLSRSNEIEERMRGGGERRSKVV